MALIPNQTHHTLQRLYGRTVDELEQVDPDRASIIRGYVAKLRRENATMRARLRDLKEGASQVPADWTPLAVWFEGHYLASGGDAIEAVKAAGAELGVSDADQ